MAHRNLRFEYHGGFEDDADDDEHAVAGQCKVNTKDNGSNHRDDSNEAEEDSTQQSDLIERLLDVIDSRLTGTNAGDGAAVLLKIVGDLHGIVRDRYIEIVEENNQDEEQNAVERLICCEIIVDPLGKAVLCHERSDGRGQHAEGAGKDDRHNAGHQHLHGQVSLVAAVHFTTDNTLGILNRNTSFGTVDPNNTGNH